MHTWIKICGTTSVEDALSSIQAGADALGFIFAQSKRQVTTEQAQQIINQVSPKMEKIGVFMNNTAAEIADVVSKVALTGIQLHGEESVEEVHRCLPGGRRDALRKIKTVLVKDGLENRFDITAAHGVVDAWLLDSGAGSGKTFDWQAAKTGLDSRGFSAGGERLIIAGGLTPENVGEAIRTFRPWGVDVVSGVESAPGRKDPEKLKAFVAAVRRAETL